jgi:hypothetical protein
MIESSKQGSRIKQGEREKGESKGNMRHRDLRFKVRNKRRKTDEKGGKRKGRERERREGM